MAPRRPETANLLEQEPAAYSSSSRGKLIDLKQRDLHRDRKIDDRVDFVFQLIEPNYFLITHSLSKAVQMLPAYLHCPV